MPERIETAVNTAVRAIYDLRDAMHDRTEHFQRILLTIGVICVTNLALLFVVISAVYGHIPILRVKETNDKRTAQFIMNLNCTVLWANDKRITGCEDIYARLDAIPRIED